MGAGEYLPGYVLPISPPTYAHEFTLYVFFVQGE